MNFFSRAVQLLFTGLALPVSGKNSCAPISGNYTVGLQNIYPEGVEFFPPSCKIFVGSLNNNSIVEFDPYTSQSRVINFPGVSHNKEHFVCGIDYSKATDTIYVAASGRAAWYNGGKTTMGWNLTGPNRLIHYSPLKDKIIWDVDLNPAIEEVERANNALIGGFQDMAEDKDGNAYSPAAFGNVIFKVNPKGAVSVFYDPKFTASQTQAYGFGGYFVTEQNVLVLADAVTQSFYRFDLSSSKPAEPIISKPTGVPDNYPTSLYCDALIALERFDQKVALCSDVFDSSVSSHGITSVYYSGDGWKTSEYIGAVPTNFKQSPDAWSTAVFEALGRSYALSSALPYAEGKFPQVDETPLIDVTENVIKLLKARESTRSIADIEYDIPQHRIEL